MSTETSRLAPRAVTREEQSFFADNGWVKLDGLLSEEATATLRGRLEEKMGVDAAIAHTPPATHAATDTRIHGTHSRRCRSRTPREKLPMTSYSFSHSPEIGAVGRALLGGPVRYWIDQSLVNMPAGSDGSGETGWHSDIGGIATSPFDPPVQVQIWIALTDITPELGSLRFVAPKDTDDEVRALIAEKGVEGSYPELERRGILSPQLHMKAGDATVHGSNTLHSAPPNKTDRVRWAYIVSVFPAQTRFTGNHFWPTEGVEGVKQGETFPDHRYPVLA